MNQNISDAYFPPTVDSCPKKARKVNAEQGEAVVGLGSSVLSLFTAVVIFVIASFGTSYETFITPGMALILCISTGCTGVLVSLWALILRPGWIPVLGMFVGMIAILAGMCVSFLLGMSQLGAHPL